MAISLSYTTPACARLGPPDPRSRSLRRRRPQARRPPLGVSTDLAQTPDGANRRRRRQVAAGLGAAVSHAEVVSECGELRELRVLAERERRGRVATTNTEPVLGLLPPPPASDCLTERGLRRTGECADTWT